MKENGGMHTSMEENSAAAEKWSGSCHQYDNFAFVMEDEYKSLEDTSLDPSATARRISRQSSLAVIMAFEEDMCGNEHESDGLFTVKTSSASPRRISSQNNLAVNTTIEGDTTLAPLAVFRRISSQNNLAVNSTIEGDTFGNQHPFNISDATLAPPAVFRRISRQNSLGVNTTIEGDTTLAPPAVFRRISSQNNLAVNSTIEGDTFGNQHPFNISDATLAPPAVFRRISRQNSLGVNTTIEGDTTLAPPVVFRRISSQNNLAVNSTIEGDTFGNQHPFNISDATLAPPAVFRRISRQNSLGANTTVDGDTPGNLYGSDYSDIARETSAVLRCISRQSSLAANTTVDEGVSVNQHASDNIFSGSKQDTNSGIFGSQHASPDVLQLPTDANMIRRRHQSDCVTTRDRKNSVDACSMTSIVTSMTSVSNDSASVCGGYNTLIYSRHEAVALKDFNSEARAFMDVSSYLKNMALLLDVDKTDVDDIVEACLLRILEDAKNKDIYDQARSALFTHDLVHQLSHTVQGTSITEDGTFDYDHNWICAMCSIPDLPSRRVCIARLLHPANLGINCQEVHFLIVILVPKKEKETKNELEIARTFGTIFSDMDFRQALLDVTSEKAFEQRLVDFTRDLAARHSGLETRVEIELDDCRKILQCRFLRGISGDLRRRLPHYLSDYKDGIYLPKGTVRLSFFMTTGQMICSLLHLALEEVTMLRGSGVADKKSICKTISCTVFLYFACILPCIAFGILNYSNTKGALTVEKVFCSQVFGGIIFATLGGTPHIVLLATAPLALYTQIIFSLSVNFGLNFEAFFACTGLFNCMFLVLFSVLDLSVLMQFSTRSSEEIFAMFISIAFSVDVYRNFVQNFKLHYCDSPIAAIAGNIVDTVNVTMTFSNNTDLADNACAREVSLLYLLLLLGTFSLGVTMYTFRNTPYLTAAKRQLLADYSLPVTVILMALVGVFLFRDVHIGKSFEPLEFHSRDFFKWVDLTLLPWEAVVGACGLGFCLSLLFFMDQNMSAAVVNAPYNKLKKGTCYHWDLLVIAAINAVLSMLCFPLVHASLTHSSLHVHALADVEERVDRGQVHQITVKVRETRLTNIFSHVLIGLSLLILSLLAYIPTPVLYGMFLCIAATALFKIQLFERILLFVTEQSAYPPNHYIRRVPQRKMHMFTGLQLLQLLVLVAVGFAPYPYVKLFFPMVIFLLIPVRHKLIPKVIEDKYLKAMDGEYK